MDTVTPSAFAALQRDGILFQFVHNRPLLRTLHRHTFFELVIVLSGSCTHVLDDVPCPMTAGDAVWIRPAQSHRFSAQSESVGVASLSVTAAHLCTVGVPTVLQTGCVLRLSPSALRYLTDLAEQTATATDAARAAMSDGVLHVFCGAAIQQSHPQPTIPLPLRSAMIAMRQPENLRGGVPAFRALMHFSPAQLCRWTQRYLHESPQAFVQRLRLQTACEWLQSDLPLPEIAEYVGFSSYSHFHAQFKQMYGLTPAQMRRKNEGQVRTV